MFLTIIGLLTLIFFCIPQLIKTPSKAEAKKIIKDKNGDELRKAYCSRITVIKQGSLLIYTVIINLLSNKYLNGFMENYAPEFADKVVGIALGFGLIYGIAIILKKILNLNEDKIMDILFVGGMGILSIFKMNIWAFFPAIWLIANSVEEEYDTSC